MKKGIHPENYRTVLFYDSNANKAFSSVLVLKPTTP